MSQMLKVAALLPLKRSEYLRGKLDVKNLERMREALTGRDWPFPPIQARKLDKPRKVKGVEFHYAIIDGEHRRFLAVESKHAAIPADVVRITEAQADVESLRVNITHGALVDKKKRGAWVKRLVKLRKVKVPALAKMLHMTPRSIYRMLRDIEGMNRPTKKNAKRSPKKDGTAPTEPSWTVEGFFVSLASVTKDARKHADVIQTFYRAHKDKLETHVGPLLEILQ